MTKRLLLIISLLTFTCMAAWCGTQYAGGDISLLPKYEEKGAIYYDENGKRITDMLSYLKASGLNAMRVRLFVDPSKANAEDQGEGVCQDLPFVASLGQRIKAAGFKLLLDIHYSDTWTDPGQHSTPSSWTVQSALADSVYSYTERVLYTLIAAGATPDFIQVGNEVTYGMLWPTGHCYPNGTNYGNGRFEMFANYLKCGIQACREVCPNAKIVVHTEMSRASNVISFYNTLKDYTTDFDIIGLSYYPYWHGGTSVLDGLLTTLETLNAHHNVNGLYWWFPEANEYGISYVNHVTTDWYNCGWWDNQNGRVMDALFEVAKYADNSEDEPTDSASIYIVGGEGNWSLTEPLAKMTYSGNGIYVDTLTISAPIYFVFADGGPENWNNDWTAFNANYRYGPTATTTVTTGATYSTAKRDNNYSYYFTGDGSDYLFTFDVDNLTFTLDRVGLLGDVNNDRQVNIQDVTILIDYLLGSTMTSFDTTNADVNQDKTINIADVTSLIDRLLAG